MPGTWAIAACASLGLASAAPVLAETNVKPDRLTLIRPDAGQVQPPNSWAASKGLAAAIGARGVTMAKPAQWNASLPANTLLQYSLNFPVAGTYYVDVLASVAMFGTKLPFTLGLNGNPVPGGNTDYDFGPRWGDGMAQLAIAVPGHYVLDLWSNEPGLSIGGISLSPSPFVRAGMPHPVASQAMLDSIAVDVHMENTPGPYTDVNGVIASLQWLGCTTVRFAFVNAQSLGKARMLAASGIKLDVLIRSETESAYTVDEQLALAAQLAPYVVSLEGLNEPDIEGAQYGQLTGIPAAIAVTRRIHNFVQATASLQGAWTIAPSIGSYDPKTIAQLGNVAKFVTNDNAHVYPSGISPPFWALDPSLQFLLGEAPGRPTMMTEFGYNSMVGQGGVDETVQAKDILDGLFDAYRVGVQRTFLYELYNNLASLTGGGTPEDYYGLFNADVTPRLVSTAIHNLSAILADPGGNGLRAKPLHYTVTGLPWYAWQMLLAKSDGSYVVALWAEQQIWDGNAEIPAPPTTVTITLPHPAHAAGVFDPLTGQSAIATYINATSIAVSLTDHPILVQIQP